MDKLDLRLSGLGASGYHFVEEENDLKGDLREENKSSGSADLEPGDRYSSSLFNASNVVDVKTLVWEVILVMPHEPPDGKDEGMQKRVMNEVVDHYFVTALQMEDRVDLQRLYSLVKAKTLISRGSDLGSTRLAVRLAERAVAEELTGFVSGTMPCIAHTTEMPLYIDSLLASEDRAIVSIGSGANGHSLYIPITEVIRIARSTSEVHVESLSVRANGSNIRFPLNGNEERWIGNNHTGSAYAASSSLDLTDAPTEMVRTVGKKRRSMLLRKTAKKRGNAALLRKMLSELDDDEFPSLMEVENGGGGGVDKNALHLAAWKGDLESITLLIERGKMHHLDLVNSISVGEGNYGKAPLFYALTQCRDDVVLHLISQGATLLTVNNKGQTPCSIAVSHLKPETCQILYDIEASQLQAGGTFRNYRITDSDGKQYGDLDPRFDLDDDNMGKDIISELSAYGDAIKKFTGRDVEEIANTERILLSTTIPGLPRSIRKTARHWNLPKYIEEGESSKMPPKNRNSKGQKMLTKKERTLLHKSQMAAIEQDIDFESLVTLTGRNLSEEEHIFRLVDDEESLKELAKVVDRSVAEVQAKVSLQAELSDEDTVADSWGLDCEWRPKRFAGCETPVATLQLSHSGSRMTFLVDVQNLIQRFVKDPNAAMTGIEETLSDVLGKIFFHPHIAILTFGGSQDLGKLAASFPHVPCFRICENIIDLHSLSRNVYPGKPKSYMSSLRKMVALLANKNLDKTNQCSDWEQRPFTASQIDYACLDAAVLPPLLQALICRGPISDIYNGSFLSNHSFLRSTLRMTCFGVPDQSKYKCRLELAYQVSMGSVKEHLYLLMARQVWQTGQEPPEKPALLSIEAQLSIANNTSRRNNRKASKCFEEGGKSEIKEKKKIKKKVLKLSTLSTDQDRLPTPGQIIGYTKDSCIHTCLGADFVESLGDHTRLGFNRRGGVIDLANAYLIFVNFALQNGALPAHWLYRNDFLENGRQLTFSVNMERPNESALANHSPHIDDEADGSQDNKIILLFARAGTQAKFLFCGKCAIASKTTTDNYANLILELLDYSALKGDESTYMDIVKLHAMSVAKGNALRHDDTDLSVDYHSNID